MAALGEIDFIGLVNKANDGLRRIGLDTGRVTGQLSSAAISSAAEYATNRDDVRVNRARAAAAVDYGYDKMEQYERWRPTIFVASSAVCALSLALMFKRRRVPEAYVVYLTSAAASAGMAWFSRPDALRPAPAPMPPLPPGQEPPPGAMAQVLGWLDRRVQANTSADPGWEARTWRRVARDLGYGTLDPHTEVLLVRNSL